MIQCSSDNSYEQVQGRKWSSWDGMYRHILPSPPSYQRKYQFEKRMSRLGRVERDTRASQQKYIRLNWGWRSWSRHKLPNNVRGQWCFHLFEWTWTGQDRLVSDRVRNKAKGDWDTRWWEFKHEFQLFRKVLTWAKSCKKHLELSGIFFRGGDNKVSLKGGTCYLFWSEATCIIHGYYRVDDIKNTY